MDFELYQFSSVGLVQIVDLQVHDKVEFSSSNHSKVMAFNQNPKWRPAAIVDFDFHKIW